LRRFILGAQSEPLAIIEKLDPEKPSFRPSKWPQKLKTAKNSKLPKLPENCFERVGKGGWPPISTWIRTHAPSTFFLEYHDHMGIIGDSIGMDNTNFE
jgi:hypothetical protein